MRSKEELNAERIEERAKHARNERWYKASLQENYIGNEMTGTLLRKLYDSLEPVAAHATELLRWQISDNSSDSYIAPVGSDEAAEIKMVDGTTCEAFVMAYLPQGVVLEHLEEDPSEGKGYLKRCGREFVPYHRVSSILEGRREMPDVPAESEPSSH